MKKTIYHSIKYKFHLLLFLLLLCGCEDFLEVEEPLGQINSAEVFEDEATATAAVTSLYGKLRDEVLLTGKAEGLGVLMGIYSDEMIYYGFGGEPLDNFYQHQVFPDDLLIENLWNVAYSLIYMCNGVLEGLANSTKLSEESKSQLQGETLFVRAFAYSYLVELFGDIPFPITTDYEVNNKLSKLPIPTIYENIISDLLEAKTLLGTTYISGERVRANKIVATALLARIYLYTEQWELAVAESNTLINNSVISLEPNIESEFLKESTSAMLQFKPKFEGGNTEEASTYLFATGPPPFVSLTPQLIESFEDGDLRRQLWVGEVTDGTETWFYPNKYKLQTNTGTSMEYSIVLRLAEQYLIRAEARAKLGQLTGALEDLNTIRNRAGLMDSEATTQNEILEAISLERYHELFSEFGHRWFDIKRLGIANEILAPIKPGWKPTDIHLPLPENELLMNPNLNPQNPGY
tara:strand:- start:3339 stop:4730 length:1392 start_codon:yes stop_codon:yes gene_type:complete